MWTRGRGRILAFVSVLGICFMLMSFSSMAESDAAVTYRTWTEKLSSADGENREIYSAVMTYPVFGGNTIAARRMNREMTDALKTFRQRAAENEKEAQESYNEGDPVFQYGGSHADEEKYTAEFHGDYVDILDEGYTYSGGAHGMYGTTAGVYAKSDGNKVSLSGFLAGRGAAKKDVSDYMIRSLKKYQDNGGFLLPEFETYVADLVNDGKWYVLDHNLVIIANPYEVASYAQGQFLFYIPFSGLSSLKDTEPVSLFSSYMATDILKEALSGEPQYDAENLSATVTELPDTGEAVWVSEVGIKDGEEITGYNTMIVDMHGNVKIKYDNADGSYGLVPLEP
jgi:hypothetical protein